MYHALRLYLEHGPDSNRILLIPDAGTGISKPLSWPLQLFLAVTPHIRILDFSYQPEKQNDFSWYGFVELGDSLVDALVTQIRNSEARNLYEVQKFKVQTNAEI